MVDTVIWARGTLAALERVNGSSGTITPAQTFASLEQENARLRHQIELQARRIRELEALNAQPQDLVTMSRAAEIMAVHPSTITRWVAAGHFQMRSIGGRKHPMIVASSLHRPARKQRSSQS
jgi:predicted DNA-binding protein (UPF0251 family)